MIRSARSGVRWVWKNKTTLAELGCGVGIEIATSGLGTGIAVACFSIASLWDIKQGATKDQSPDTAIGGGICFIAERTATPPYLKAAGALCGKGLDANSILNLLGINP